jgi:hypothetical protein
LLGDVGHGDVNDGEVILKETLVKILLKKLRMDVVRQVIERHSHHLKALLLLKKAKNMLECSCSGQTSHCKVEPVCWCSIGKHMDGSVLAWNQTMQSLTDARTLHRTGQVR